MTYSNGNYTSGGSLPNGWRMACVGDILKIRNGFAFRSSDYKQTGVPLIRQSELKSDVIDLTGAKRVDPSCLKELHEFAVREGDLLIGMSGSLGKIAEYQHREPALQNQRTGLLMLSPGYNAKFARLILKLVEPQIIALGKGVAVQNVSSKEIEACVFPLPPPDDQKRIVAEIEKQFTRLDAGVAALRRTQANLKRYRAAVLKAACEGRLLPDSPGEWKQATLAEVCTKITDGDHQPPPRAAKGIPFLTIGNISSGKLDFENTRYVPETYYNCIKGDRVPRRDDIVYSVVGATIGIPVLVDTDRPFCFQRHIALLKPSASIIPKYLWIAMASPATLKAAWQGVTGTAQPTLPLRVLRRLPIYLPPVASQTRIVAEVDLRLSVVEKLETIVEANLQRAVRLRQSTLHDAFSAKSIS